MTEHIAGQAGALTWAPRDARKTKKSPRRETAGVTRENDNAHRAYSAPAGHASGARRTGTMPPILVEAALPEKQARTVTHRSAAASAATPAAICAANSNFSAAASSAPSSAAREQMPGVAQAVLHHFERQP